MAGSPPSSAAVIFSLVLFAAVVVASADELIIKPPKEKTTHLRFYLHDTLSGPHPSAIRVVTGPANQSVLNFGDLMVIDDPLTKGPNLTSKLVGRAQGFYTRVSQEDLTLMMTMNLVFLEGKYNGSTLAVLGRNPILSPVRELAVVGGSGRFRLARGYILDKTYSIDSKTGDGIFEFDVYVMHY